MGRTSILLFAGCAIVVVGLYGFSYWFGPESAAPDPAAMRRFRLNQLSDAELKEIVEKANEARDEQVARIRAGKKHAAERELAESAAREKTVAQCADDPVFKLRNETLCDPPGGFVTGPAVPDVPEPTAEEFIEGYIMGPCLEALTIREARRIGCLSPK